MVYVPARGAAKDWGGGVIEDSELELPSDEDEFCGCGCGCCDCCWSDLTGSGGEGGGT